jgi:hypothetical protein
MTTEPKTLPKSITIIGRRWFDRRYGNTYYSAQIIVDGEPIEGIAYAYGYGDQYAHEAMEKLEAQGIIPKREPGEPFWALARRLGIAFHYSASDVQRKKDL